MKRTSCGILLIACAMAGCQSEISPVRSGWPVAPPIADAQPVVSAGPLPGQYPAGSIIIDKKALGGFGPCDNYPFDLAGQDWGRPNAISLVAFPDEPAAYFKSRGMALRLINRTKKTVEFYACDSALPIVRQALDDKKQWQAIETLPQTFCGNSFHRVFLKPNQFWQFPARVYAGPLKTKMRFHFEMNGQPNIDSNEFEGNIDPAQLVTVLPSKP